MWILAAASRALPLRGPEHPHVTCLWYVCECPTQRETASIRNRHAVRTGRLDYNAKLPRSNGQQMGRWCIHRRGNQAGDMLGSLMERKQLCAVSTLHQPRRHATNATSLSKDRRDMGHRRLTISWPHVDGPHMLTRHGWNGECHARDGDDTTTTD